MTDYRTTAWNTGALLTVTTTDLRDGRKRRVVRDAVEDSPETRDAMEREAISLLEDRGPQ